MKFQINIPKKVNKNINKLPLNIVEKLGYLVKDLSANGPIRANWQNYSEIDQDKYHCHLSKSWVACWKHKKKTIIIEVYYVGSREKAPY